MMRVLIADDHVLFRAGLRALLSALPFITDIYEAGDGRQAVAVARAERPDVVLMDVAMPVMNGFEAMSRILKDMPETRVLILSMYEDEEFVWRALRLGASGYIAKSSAVAELEAALQSVSSDVYISPTLRTTANDEEARRRGEPDPQRRLTPRQREILQLIAEGMTSRQIAEELKIHIKTVESHRMHLMKRLGIHDVAGLVRYAIRHKVVLNE